jgi:hypothetical protein
MAVAMDSVERLPAGAVYTMRSGRLTVSVGRRGRVMEVRAVADSVAGRKETLESRRFVRAELDSCLVVKKTGKSKGGKWWWFAGMGAAAVAAVWWLWRRGGRGGLG